MCAKIDVIRDFKHISESSLGEQIVVHGDLLEEETRKTERKKDREMLLGSVSVCVCVCVHRENRSQKMRPFRKSKT